MNLIKALEGLSANSDKTETEQPAPADADKTRPAPPPERITELPNAMASVIERHERISNRVRNKR